MRKRKKEEIFWKNCTNVRKFFQNSRSFFVLFLVLLPKLKAVKKLRRILIKLDI